MKCIGLKFQTLDLDCRTHSFKYKKSGFKDIKDSNIRIHIVQETLGVLFCWSKMENMFRFVKYLYSIYISLYIQVCQVYVQYLYIFRFVKYMYSIYIYIHFCQLYVQHLYIYSGLPSICTVSIYIQACQVYVQYLYIFRFVKYMYNVHFTYIKPKIVGGLGANFLTKILVFNSCFSSLYFKRIRVSIPNQSVSVQRAGNQRVRL